VQNNSACSITTSLPPDNFYVCVVTPVAITWQPTPQILSAIQVGATTPTPPDINSQSSLMPAIIGVVLGGIVLGLGVTTLFLLRRYKKAKKEKQIVRVLVPVKPLEAKPKSQLSELIPARSAYSAEPVQTENPIMRSPLFKTEVPPSHADVPEMGLGLGLGPGQPRLHRRASIATFLPRQVPTLQRTSSICLPPPSSLPRRDQVPASVRRIGGPAPSSLTNPHAQSSRKIGAAPMQAPRVRVVKATNSAEVAASAVGPSRNSVTQSKSIRSLINKFNSAKDVMNVSHAPQQIRRINTVRHGQLPAETPVLAPTRQTAPTMVVVEPQASFQEPTEQKSQSYAVAPAPAPVPAAAVEPEPFETAEVAEAAEAAEVKEEEATGPKTVILSDDILTEDAPLPQRYATTELDETTGRFAHGPQQIGQRA